MRLQQLRTIGDFIAGMTDRFAIARHEELIGPVNLAAESILTKGICVSGVVKWVAQAAFSAEWQ